MQLLKRFSVLATVYLILLLCLQIVWLHPKIIRSIKHTFIDSSRVTAVLLQQSLQNLSFVSAEKSLDQLQLPVSAAAVSHVSTTAKYLFPEVSCQFTDIRFFEDILVPRVCYSYSEASTSDIAVADFPAVSHFAKVSDDLNFNWEEQSGWIFPTLHLASKIILRSDIHNSTVDVFLTSVPSSTPQALLIFDLDSSQLLSVYLQHFFVSFFAFSGFGVCLLFGCVYFVDLISIKRLQLLQPIFLDEANTDTLLSKHPQPKLDESSMLLKNDKLSDLASILFQFTQLTSDNVVFSKQLLNELLEPLVYVNEVHQVCLLNSSAELLFKAARSLTPTTKLYAELLQSWTLFQAVSNLVTLALTSDLTQTQCITDHETDRTYNVTAVVLASTTVPATVGVVLSFQDITDNLRTEHLLLENEKKLYTLSHYDSLTNLPNRQMILTKLDKHLNDKVPFLVLVSLGVNRFRKINDVLGHVVGDVVLRKIAVRLTTLLSMNDTLARTGGDEFMYLITSVRNDQESLGFIAELLKLFQTPIVVDNHDLSITVIVGISFYPTHANTSTDLLKYSNIAFCKSKSLGRDTYCIYSNEFSKFKSESLVMETELKAAIKYDQLFLHYQPQISVKDGSLVGAEVLVRWEHPTKGLVSPAKFIELAEETGLILPLGAWVLRQACQQLQKWTRSDVSIVPLAVNVSAYQLQNSAFIDLLDQLLVLHNLSAEYLELEITESTIMTHFEQAAITLREINTRGIKLAIDDFGTGYSSLSYLQRFPIDKLKIDRSFISEIYAESSKSSIVSAIISMCRSLNLTIVAEGVEEEYQLEFLRREGCDVIQGFYYSAPISAEEFEETFLRSRKDSKSKLFPVEAR